MKIGIDLDHTIINYDTAILTAAKKQNLVPSNFIGDKNTVKTWIQTQHSEADWMRVQGYVYGRGIGMAELMPNVTSFLLQCQQLSIPFKIISHKTQFGHFDTEKTDLREAACNFLSQQVFFKTHFSEIKKHHLYFASTRVEKLRLIAEQKCTIFIDDLLELLLEPHFPKNVARIWYTNGKNQLHCSVPNNITILNTWKNADEILMVQHEKT